MAKRKYTKMPIPKNKNPKRGIAKRINEACEVAPICGRLSCPITLWGNEQIIIEDVKEVLHIDENIITIGSGKGKVTVVGAFLTLCCVNENSIIITGEISSVEFE